MANIAPSVLSLQTRDSMMFQWASAIKTDRKLDLHNTSAVHTRRYLHTCMTLFTDQVFLTNEKSLRSVSCSRMLLWIRSLQPLDTLHINLRMLCQRCCPSSTKARQNPQLHCHEVASLYDIPRVLHATAVV